MNIATSVVRDATPTMPPTTLWQEVNEKRMAQYHNRSQADLTQEQE